MFASFRTCVRLVEMAFERVQALCPHRAVGREPRVDLTQRLRPDPVVTPLRVDPGLDQADFTQHPQVLRYRGLADPKRAHQVTDRTLTVDQQVQDAATVRLGHHLECGAHSHWSNITDRLYTRQAMDPRNIRGGRQIGEGMARTSDEILASATTIAVVGASRDPSKAGGSVPEGLQRRGFRIIPINPYADTLFGERVYRSLLEVPEKIDIVDVFRPSADTPEIARQAVAVGARALWLQLDIRSPEARRIAESAGLEYVEDECTAVVASLYRIKRNAA